jgi:hypothetical protein
LLDEDSEGQEVVSGGLSTDYLDPCKS